MFKHDGEFRWRMKRKYISAQDFQTYVTGAGIGAGAPVFAEIAASAITAVDVNAAGDELGHFMPVPYDLDVKKHIYFRILWGLGGTVASGDTVHWILT